MIEPSWSSRNLILKEYNIENKEVIDFGCGDKSILNYLNFKSYIGFDKNQIADYCLDFNESFNITITAEVGLILGVLEYLDDPDAFIKTVKPSCQRFIIMVLSIKGPKVSKGWKRVYNENTFRDLLANNFSNYSINKVNKYLIGDITV